MEIGACQAIVLDDTERIVTAVKAKWKEDGGVGAAPRKVLRTTPFRTSENALWNIGEGCSHQAFDAMDHDILAKSSTFMEYEMWS